MKRLPLQQVQQALGTTIADLETSWMALEALLELANGTIRQADAEYAEACDFGRLDVEAKAEYARQVDILTESMHVLDAWAEFAHAVYVFSTHGYCSVFFENTPMAFLADVPEILRAQHGHE